MGTFRLPLLGHPWRLQGRLFGEKVPSEMDQGPEFQDCSFQQLGAGHTFTSILCALRLGLLVSLHWHPAKRQETANSPPLCWGRGSKKTKVRYLPSKSSGLMGERLVTNLSTALKLCPKGLQQRGRSNSFSVTSVRSHICRSRGGEGQHGQSGALGAQSGRVTHPGPSGLRKAELRARMGQWVKY